MDRAVPSWWAIAVFFAFVFFFGGFLWWIVDATSLPDLNEIPGYNVHSIQGEPAE